MATPKRVRWDCPNGAHPGVLASTRPPRDAIVRYCLPCSEAAGRLVERVAPALEAKRAAATASQKAKAAAARRRAAQQRERAKAAETERYTVEGVDLRDELARLVRLRAFGGARGRLARRPPEFTVTRRPSKPQTRLGFAGLWANRIHLSTWPGLTLALAREMLVHELAHLHVGVEHTGVHHGDDFWRAMDRAFEEAYGVRVFSSLRDNSYVGRHAEALAAASTSGGAR